MEHLYNSPFHNFLSLFCVQYTEQSYGIMRWAVKKTTYHFLPRGSGVGPRMKIVQNILNYKNKINACKNMFNAFRNMFSKNYFRHSKRLKHLK